MLIPNHVEDELPDGLYKDEKGGLFYYCRRCERPTEWPEDAESYSHGDSMNLCGGSPWCCP